MSSEPDRMPEAHSAPPGGRFSRTAAVYATAIVIALLLAFAGERTPQGILLFESIPYAFVLFVLVLLGVALLHHHTLAVSLTGAGVITAYTALFCPGYAWSAAEPGLWHHFLHEAEHTMLNLGALLIGFALLADIFEHSGVPDRLPRILPKRPLLGAFTLLAMVWVLSSFLDNIAAAMIGGVVAVRAFRGTVTVGYIAAIVAASNAGGAWSVLGDTTTTMMWIDQQRHISALDVFHAIVASAVALLCFGFIAARQQIRVQPVDVDLSETPRPVDWLRLLNVVLILAGAIATNFLLGRPFVGVWAALLLGALWRAPAWHLVPASLKGTLFLLGLIWCASLMPVQALPGASWQTAFGLGFVSSVFDNIPLTKLALAQGGYDWGVLSFAVGFGGSMLWFGSSAGVAISVAFPSVRHTGRYLAEGWSVSLAYVAGFLAMLGLLGWHPHA
jgi:Na+/H+ antiporter NhaD/arsenite permease-like protein